MKERQKLDSETMKAIQRDLIDNVQSTLRAAGALAVFGGFGTPGLESVQKARLALSELLIGLGLESSIKDISSLMLGGGGISYAGMAPREAVILDLALFGEQRPLTEIQEHVFGLGFEREREGQIRSSINARGNLGVFFTVVGENEIVSLTPRGSELAAKLKKQRGIS